jgi:hypothetical protein
MVIQAVRSNFRINIEYNPKVNGKVRSDYAQFLGCFDYAQSEKADAMTGAT